MTPYYCDQTGYLILKFVGVFPSGLNRLHEAIVELNQQALFLGSKVELLDSKFTKDHGTYVIEIKVPFLTRNGSTFNEKKVPLSVLAELFNAVKEFQPQ